MARQSILHGITMDNSGLVYPTPFSTEITMTNIKDGMGIVIGDPAGADIGFSGVIKVPDNFSSTPKIRVYGILDGAPAAAAIAAFGFRQNQFADNEAFDAAYETDVLWQQTIGSSGSAHSDEDLLVMLSGALNGTWAASDIVPYFFYRDDSIDTFAGKLIVVELELDYTAA